MRHKANLSFFVRHWYLGGISLILFLSTCLRINKIDQIPAGLTWDEAAIGYNGFAILHTRRDEWLTKLPISFRSFGDYKAPLAIYINGVFTYFFGMTVFGVRLPFALSGILAVLGMTLLCNQLLKFITSSSQHPLSLFDRQMISLFLGFLMSVSVWHLHFSRAGFESGIALTFMIWGSFFLYYFINTVRGSLISTASICLSGALFTASLYSYHSAKISVPAFLVLFALYHHNQLRKRTSQLIFGITFSCLLLFPMILDTIQAQGAARLGQTSIFSPGASPTIILSKMSTNLLTHLSPAFLLFGQTTTLRHGDGQTGVLYPTELLALIFAVCVTILGFLIRKQYTTFHVLKYSSITGLFWILAGLLPASIGMEVPHPNRALLALPGVYIVVISALVFLFDHPEKMFFPIGVRIKKHLFLPLLLGSWSLCHILLFVAYQHQYYTVYSKSSSSAFFYGYQQAFEYAIKHEESVDKILFTTKYGQPYIYALFFRQTHPNWYQWGSLAKYEFTDKITDGDLLRTNTLIVASPDQIIPDRADEVVTSPDGQIRFTLKKTN